MSQYDSWITKDIDNIASDDYGTRQTTRQMLNNEEPPRPRPPRPLPHVDTLNTVWEHVDRDLLVSKIFYFFFFSAFGSLFPLMAVYFKQLGMNANQTGFLIGIRPFIEILSAPFWSSLADRFRKCKVMLLFSLFCWIVFTLSLAFIRPPASACVIYNDTHHILYTPYSDFENTENAVTTTISKRALFASRVKARKASFQTPHQFLQTKLLLDDSGNENQLTDYIRKRYIITPDMIKRAERIGGEEMRDDVEAAPMTRNNNNSSDQATSEPLRPELSQKSTPNVDAAASGDEKVMKGIDHSSSEAEIRDQIHSVVSLREPNEEQGRSRARRDSEGKKKGKSKDRHKPPPNLIIGKSPTSVEYTLNYNKQRHTSYVSPPFSTVVYKLEDVKEVFFLLLLLILLGEFFSAPAITLADCATLTYLGENTDLYGKQRMFGSVGWGITMFLMGMALDNSTEFPDHPCGAHEGERNYLTCFTIFTVLMAAAFLAATQFRFEYDLVGNPELETDQMQMKQWYDNGPRPIFNTAPPINAPQPDKKFEFIDRWKSAVFAQRTRELPEWVTVFKQFANVRYGAFLFVTWFMGFGIGLVFAFLFWHLQDLGGTPTLFGVASVINHTSEIFAYFFSFQFIKKFGHTKVLCIGLLGNVGRFLYIAWLDNPWWVLPFEFIQGITHAAVWAACCSYINQAIPEPQLRSSTQGVLQGLHHGLGRGCGAIIGGLFVNSFGTRTTFCLYGLLSIVVLGVFVFVNYYRKDQGFRFFEEDGLDNRDVIIDDSSALAPHGVPSNPIAKSLSRQDLQKQQAANQEGSSGGTANPFKSADGFLDPNAAWSQPAPNQTQYGLSEMNEKPLFVRSPSDSPKFVIEYDFIKKGFQALFEATNNTNEEEDLKKPQHVMEVALYQQQPIIECDSSYDW